MGPKVLNSNVPFMLQILDACISKPKYRIPTLTTFYPRETSGNASILDMKIHHLKNTKNREIIL